MCHSSSKLFTACTKFQVILLLANNSNDTMRLALSCQGYALVVVLHRTLEHSSLRILRILTLGDGLIAVYCTCPSS